MQFLLVKEYSDVSTTMIVFDSLPNCMFISVLLIYQNAGVRQKARFLVKISLIGMGSSGPTLIGMGSSGPTLIGMGSSVGPLEPMRIKDILTKQPVFCRTPAF